MGLSRLQLMPITSDTRWLPDSQCGKETHPEILKPRFAQSWFSYCLYYGDVLGSFAAGSGVADTKTLTAVTLSSWILPHVLQRKSPLRCKRVHIKNPPAPLCSGLCISWCLDTYRSLNKEACQRGASVHREIIQTVRHRLIKTSSPFTALVLH